MTWLKGNSNAVINSSGGKLIAKPHVKVGDNVIMIMPDGKLEPVNKSQITDWTNDKVKWKTPEDMVDIVLKDPASAACGPAFAENIYLSTTAPKKWLTLQCESWRA